MEDGPRYGEMELMAAQNNLQRTLRRADASKDMVTHRKQYDPFPWNLEPKHFEQMAGQMLKQGHSPEDVAYALENYQNTFGTDVSSVVQQYRSMGRGAPPVGQGVDTTQYNAGG